MESDHYFATGVSRWLANTMLLFVATRHTLRYAARDSLTRRRSGDDLLKSPFKVAAGEKDTAVSYTHLTLPTTERV